VQLPKNTEKYRGSRTFTFSISATPDSHTKPYVRLLVKLLCRLQPHHAELLIDISLALWHMCQCCIFFRSAGKLKHLQSIELKALQDDQVRLPKQIESYTKRLCAPWLRRNTSYR
jgi:hypothetical protein